MYTIKELKEIIEVLDQSSLTELTLEQDNQKLKLKKQVSQGVQYIEQPTQSAAVVTEKLQPVMEEQTTEKEGTTQTDTPNYDYTLKSPMVGTFYLSSSPEDAPFVSVGDTVSDQTTVCIIEAMKLFNEIEAEVNGEIIEILAKNGELVEYNQPLFGIKTK